MSVKAACWLRWCFCLSIPALAWTAVSLSVADDPAAPTRPAPKPGASTAASPEMALREFMRQKLAASNQILEGLTTDDMTLVKAGAQRLNEMSQAERWRVSNDALYRQFSGDFREITQQLMNAAEQDNADRAAMKWIDATMSCLDCHRFVRGMRIANRN